MPAESSTPLPGGGFTIVPATWHDFNAVRRLAKVCFPQDAWPFWDVFGVLSLSNVVRLKAVADGKMVGFIAVDVHAREGLAWIATIGVLPTYRRRGIASALIRASEAQLAVPIMRLTVRASNHGARRLYDALGYQEVDRWRKYYQGGEDAIMMQKSLR